MLLTQGVLRTQYHRVWLRHLPCGDLLLPGFWRWLLRSGHLNVFNTTDCTLKMARVVHFMSQIIHQDERKKNGGCLPWLTADTQALLSFSSKLFHLEAPGLLHSKALASCKSKEAER